MWELSEDSKLWQGMHQTWESHHFAWLQKQTHIALWAKRAVAMGNGFTQGSVKIAPHLEIFGKFFGILDWQRGKPCILRQCWLELWTLLILV